MKKTLALLLCLALLCAASPAAWAQEAHPIAAPEMGGPGVSPSPEEDIPAPTAETESQPSPEASPSQEPTPTPTPTPTPQRVKVTFDLGEFGTESVETVAGTAPAGIPKIPEKWGIAGVWTNAAGEAVDPAALPVQSDTVYTARWPRTIPDVLETEAHAPFVNGYPAGTFRPESSITRAEAAQMFYAVLKKKDGPKKSFPDAAGKWFTQAVEALAGQGVINGYTDGTFGPGRSITRAEFVTIAAAFDTAAKEQRSSFPDVPATHWASGSIAYAVGKGWINGYGDGTFGPERKITRAEAVTILNRILGRTPDSGIQSKTDAKNFYDVFPTHWAYGEILEAATAHSYTRSGSTESWTEYTRDTAPAAARWVADNGRRYYVDAATRKFVRGETTIDGKTYRFDESTGAAVTGFAMKDGYRRYYKGGLLQEDISGLGVVSGPYLLKVYKNANYLIVFAKDPNGNFNTPVRAMRVSCGSPTPVGTFYTPARFRWLRMEGYVWAQWCTQIQGSYLFHSVPYYTKVNNDLELGEFNLLGETRSLGCIRLNCADAKWIYDNCALKTKVIITTSESSGPLARPEGIKLPSWHTWDPTDPTAKYLCKQHGCH